MDKVIKKREFIKKSNSTNSEKLRSLSFVAGSFLNS